jgi:hypothetical protein
VKKPKAAKEAPKPQVKKKEHFRLRIPKNVRITDVKLAISGEEWCD